MTIRDFRKHYLPALQRRARRSSARALERSLRRRARKFLAAASILLMAISVSGQGSYNFYLSGEAGNSGDQVTTTILNNSTYTNLFAGTWSINPSPHTLFAVTNQHDNTLRGSHFIGNAYFDGASDTRTFQVQASGTADRRSQFTFAAPFYTGQIAFGYYWRYGVTPLVDDFVDTFHLDGIETGDYLVVAFHSANPSALRVHTNLGGGSVGPDVVVTSNTTYWVTGLWNTNSGSAGIAKVAVFSTSTWRMIGISTLAFGAKNMCEYMKFGCLNSHTITQTFPMWYDDILMLTGPNAVSLWPLLPPGATVSAASTSRTDFDTAYTNAVSGIGTNKDTVAMPSGSSTWTSGYTVAKTNLVINGNGTNNTTIIGDNGASSFTLFTVTGSLNTFSNFAVRGDLSNDEVDAFRFTGWHNRFNNLWIREVNVAFYAEGPGEVDNCVIADNWRMARVIFANWQNFYDTYYPLAWDSTNFFVMEDNQMYWTSAKNQTGSQALITSQQGQAFVIRHNYFDLNNASTDPAPWIDYHGDNPPLSDSTRRPGTGLQVYSNYVNFQSGSVSGQKSVDVRGSRSLIYSNRWVGATFDSGQGIFYREENAGDSPNYKVNNSYVWENKHGASGTTAMPVNDDANITEGVDYFASALSPLVAIPYPHPLRNVTVQGPSPTPPAAAIIGRGRSTSNFSSPE